MFSFLIVRALLGLFAVWFIAMAMVLVFSWRNKWLAKGIKRLAIAHAILLVLACILFLDFRASVNTLPLKTQDKIAIRDAVSNEGEPGRYRISLTGEEMARGIRSAADLVHMEAHSRIAFPEKDRFHGEFSLGLPFGYLNSEMDANLQIDEGKLRLRWDQLRIGRLSFPWFVRSPLAWCISYWLETEKIVSEGFSTIVSTRIDEGRVDIRMMRQGSLSSSLVAQMQTTDLSDDASMAMDVLREWIEERTKDAPPRISGASSFIDTTQDLHRIASRLAANLPRVRQNRIAILAGGIALGHPRLARLTGQALSREESAALGKIASSTQVNRRHDLVKHFWVSAALTQLASSRISIFAGISKEAMDSGAGGSGFSFADYLANHAGIRFANLATQSEAAALRMQERVAGEWGEIDLVPSIAGLPEGISQQRLKDEFGGTTGESYQNWVKEIERRLDQAKLLKDPTTTAD